MMDVGWWS